MVLDVLSRLDFQPRLVQAGDQDALEVDILLLIGEEAPFAHYTSRLSRRTGRRPITILWQLEPLPPPVLAGHAAQQRLQTANMARMLLRVLDAPTPVKKLLKTVVSFLVCTGVMPKFASRLLARLEREIGHSLPSVLRDLDIVSCLYVMRACAWCAENRPERLFDFVFTSTIPQQQFFVRRGIPADFAPIGYHPGMGCNLGRRRDIEVVFIGYIQNRRRATILRDIQRSLAARGVHLVIAERGWYGAQRTDLLNRARVSLNLVNYPWDLPALRFLLSMGCGALVVSEPLEETTPYKAGEHFIQADIPALTETICYYLERESEREAISRTAYDFLRQECTLQTTMARLMERVT